MPQVQIVTDSAVRFTSPDFLEKFSVAIAPMTVRCGATVIEESSTSDLSLVRNQHPEDQSLLEPEAPSVDLFTEIYADLHKRSDQILSIHTSSGLCKVVENAQVARQNFLGRVDIAVVDSLTVSVGLGLLVQEAAKEAARGADLETLVRIVRGMIPRLYMIFFLDDLLFLEKNGLVSKSQAILGNMLGIIPFLTMENGYMIPMEKVRSRPRALEKLIEFVLEFSSIEHLAILEGSSTPTQECNTLADRLRTFHPHTPLNMTCYGPCVSSFVGMNSLGVVVLESEEDSL
jgi:DegV family protein with EDD domain